MPLIINKLNNIISPLFAYLKKCAFVGSMKPQSLWFLQASSMKLDMKSSQEYLCFDIYN